MRRRCRRWAGAVLALWLCAPTTVTAEPEYSLLSFEDLSGWAQDDHAQALRVFRTTCDLVEGDDWAAICALALAVPDAGARAFFETLFRPVEINPRDRALFTGYFEPELDGSAERTERFRYPLYARPADAPSRGPWHSRAEIEQGLLAGRGLEIAWLDNPVDAFFLQIQGSGRIRLRDGQVIRLGYGGGNGHPYRSVGREMVRRGLNAPHEVSAQTIRAYVERHPEAGIALLHHNPSFVFFRRIDAHDARLGPLGALSRPVTALRSIAVDPGFTPLGAPVWIEKRGRRPLRRLMVAQDTGSAIRGAQRADIFYGTGLEAGEIAGRVRDPGRMVVLLPLERAFRLVPGG